MTDEEYEAYDEQKQYIDQIYPQIKERVIDASPFSNSWQVLDTDYENFLMFWSCSQETSKTNQ